MSLGLASASAAEEAREYTVQPEQSTFTIKVGRAGLFKIFGHDHRIEVRRFQGAVIWNPANIEDSSVRLDIETASLTVVDPGVKEEERAEIQADMEGEVLEVERFPSIHFESTHVDLETAEGGNHRVRLRGKLTLHGVTREIEIPLLLAVEEDELEARGSYELKGSLYGVEPVSVAGGTVKTRDELELDFDLRASAR